MSYWMFNWTSNVREGHWMTAGYLASLENQHQSADLDLHEEMKRPMPDEGICSHLKKRKLAIKDEIARISA